MPLSTDSTAVHVYRAPLDPPAGIHHALRGMLTSDERERADRFIDPLHGTRFTAGRAALRLVLAGYLRCAAESIRFDYGVKGKPFLSGRSPAFNLSHSGDLAVIAVANRGEVGIDIERRRDDLEDRKLAARFFSQGELGDLNALTGTEWQAAFYACWTRKEAYMKAVGDGFSIPLRSFRVSLLPAAPPALLDVPTDPGECARWEFREISVPAGYRACAVAHPPIIKLLEFDLNWHKPAGEVT